MKRGNIYQTTPDIKGRKKTFQSLLLDIYFWDCISNIFLPKSQGRLRKWWQMVGANANVNCIQIQFFLEVFVHSGEK